MVQNATPISQDTNQCVHVREQKATRSSRGVVGQRRAEGDLEPARLTSIAVAQLSGAARLLRHSLSLWWHAGSGEQGRHGRGRVVQVRKNSGKRSRERKV